MRSIIIRFRKIFTPQKFPASQHQQTSSACIDLHENEVLALQVCDALCDRSSQTWKIFVHSARPQKTGHSLIEITLAVKGTDETENVDSSGVTFKVRSGNAFPHVTLVSFNKSVTIHCSHARCSVSANFKRQVFSRRSSLIRTRD